MKHKILEKAPGRFAVRSKDDWSTNPITLHFDTRDEAETYVRDQKKRWANHDDGTGETEYVIWESAGFHRIS